MTTNYEHYKDEIIAIMNGTTRSCEFKRKIVGVTCETCGDCVLCEIKTKEWLEQQYTPSQDIDWLKVPKGTIVYVSDSLNEDGSIKHKKLRHFAWCTPNGYYCFSDGTDKLWNDNDTINWKYCELVLPEDVEKYKKQ